MNKIAELRKAAHLTQEKFAAIIGVARSTIAMYETNKSEPDFNILQKIADYFHVSTDYLLGRSNSTTAVQDRPVSDLAENFIREYGELFSEKEFQSYVALYKLMDARQRIFVLGMIVGWLKDQGLDVHTLI